MGPHTTKRKDRIRTVELDYMKRCLQLLQTDIVHNEIVLNKINTTCPVTKTLENRNFNSMHM